MRFGRPLHPDDLPPHQLPGAVAGQLEMLLLSLTHIHKVGMDDATKGVLMDRMAAKLTADQKAGRVSIFLDTSVIAEAENLVKDAFGFDRPRNIFDANYDPAKDGKLAGAKDEDAGGSLFGRDAFGRVRLERIAGGRANDDGREGDGRNGGRDKSDRSATYAGLSTDGYNPAYPGRPWTLTSGGYQSIVSDLRGMGMTGDELSFGTAQGLAKQGFAPTQIKAAAKLTNDLGINFDRNVAPVARLKRDVKGIEPVLRNIKGLSDKIADEEAAAQEAEARGDTEAAAVHRGKAEAARKERQDKEDKKRKEIKVEAPERVPDFDQTVKAIHEASAKRKPDLKADQSASPEPDADADLDGDKIRKAKSAKKAQATDSENTSDSSDAPPAKRRRDVAEIKANEIKPQGAAAARSEYSDFLEGGAGDDKLQEPAKEIAAAELPPMKLPIVKGVDSAGRRLGPV